MANNTQSPKTFTLTGRSFTCYQAGMKMGESVAYAASAESLRELARRKKVQFELMRVKIMDDPHSSIPESSNAHIATKLLPTLTDTMFETAFALGEAAQKCQGEGSRMMGQVAAGDTAQEARWRPPLRAWALLTLAMSVATTVATLATVYAMRAGW